MSMKKIKIPKVEKSGDFSNLNNIADILLGIKSPKKRDENIIQILPSVKYKV